MGPGKEGSRNAVSTASWLDTLLSSKSCPCPFPKLCLFGYEHGTLQPGAFPEKLYKALMSTQRSAGLPRGASPLPRGLDENKACLAAVCLPAPKLAFTRSQGLTLCCFSCNHRTGSTSCLENPSCQSAHGDGLQIKYQALALAE